MARKAPRISQGAPWPQGGPARGPQVPPRFPDAPMLPKILIIMDLMIITITITIIIIIIRIITIIVDSNHAGKQR